MNPDPSVTLKRQRPAASFTAPVFTLTLHGLAAAQAAAAKGLEEGTPGRIAVLAGNAEPARTPLTAPGAAPVRLTLTF